MHPNPLFYLLGHGVNLYGICIAVGILACLGVFYFYTKKMHMPPEMQDFIFYVAIIAIVLGFGFAYLFQAIYNWINKGVFEFTGITAMGGIIGGAGTFIFFYFVSGKFIFNGNKLGLHKKWFNEIYICAPCCITIAHAFGRIGCLMGGCCHGTFMGIEKVSGALRMCGTNGWGYYIPTQLYESIFLFALFGVLSLLYFKRCNITMPIYLIAYGIWRFLIEFLRADDAGGTFLGLRPSQWQSFAYVGIAIALLVFYKIKKIPYWLSKKTSEDKTNVEDVKE